MKELLKQGDDFYFDDDGMMVLTEQYHLKKGYCCGHGCRHCPFDHSNVPEHKKVEHPDIKIIRRETEKIQTKKG